MNHQPGIGPAAFPGGGFTSAFLDKQRAHAFDVAFSRCLTRDMIVIDAGSGTGVLSLLAARHARKVIMVEDDEDLAFMGRISTSGPGADESAFEHILVDNLASCDLGIEADAIVCDVLSTCLLQQPMAPILNNFLRHLRPGGVLVPGGVSNLCSLVDADFKPAGIPFRFAFREREDLKRPCPMTNSGVFGRESFGAPLPKGGQGSASLVATRTGFANALRLESHVTLLPELSLPPCPAQIPPLVVPLRSPIHLREGSRYRVALRYTFAAQLRDAPDIEAEVEASG